MKLIYRESLIPDTEELVGLFDALGLAMGEDWGWRQGGWKGERKLWVNESEEVNAVLLAVGMPTWEDA